MSMLCHFQQLTPTELARVQQEANNMRDLVHPELVLPDVREAMVVAQSLGKKLMGADRSTEAFTRMMEEYKAALHNVVKLTNSAPRTFVCGELNIQKAWDGVHFLLTGDVSAGATPLANAVLGGQEIGPDLGYGPARFLTPEQVREVAAALASITPQEFEKRFNWTAMEKGEIYAVHEDGAEWLRDAFERMQEYYQAAAAQGNAMLLFLD
jgi:hypothetical protein